MGKSICCPSRSIFKRVALFLLCAAILVGLPVDLLAGGAPIKAGALIKDGAPVKTGASSRTPQPSADTLRFDDVPTWDWAYTDIMSLASLGLIGGDSDGIFRPDDEITRGDFAILLYNTLEMAANADIDSGIKAKIPPYADQTVPFILSDLSEDDPIYPYASPLRHYIRARRARGSASLYLADGPLLRSEAADALVRFLYIDNIEVDETELDAFTDSETTTSLTARRNAAIAIKYGIFVGSEGGELNLGGNVSRAEACVLLRRTLNAAPWGSAIEFPSPGIYVPDAGSGYYNTFFNDAVFIGDSITQGLSIYVLNQRARGQSPLGTARFVTAVSYSIRASAADNYLSNRINLTWQGEKYPIEECLAAMNAKELYIMLGVNDGVGSNLTLYRDLYQKAMDKVNARNPGIKIRIQSCTPVTLSRENASLRNSDLDLFNDLLRDICETSGYDYIDISSPLKRADNSFRPEYSSDKYVHMSSEGCVAWLNALYEFARQKYIGGEWISDVDPELYPGVWLQLDNW